MILAFPVLDEDGFFARRRLPRSVDPRHLHIVDVDLDLGRRGLSGRDAWRAALMPAGLRLLGHVGFISHKPGISNAYLGDRGRIDSELSFSATRVPSREQFLLLLKLFNTAASSFMSEPGQPELRIQNALARLGAFHLQESDHVLPSERLDAVHDAVKEALVDGSPRTLTALAPSSFATQSA